MVGFFVNVCGINGLLASLTEGLFGLSDFSVMLCFGLGRSALRPDPPYDKSQKKDEKIYIFIDLKYSSFNFDKTYL